VGVLLDIPGHQSFMYSTAETSGVLGMAGSKNVIPKYLDAVKPAH
jgi:hypothetical protein